MHGSLTVACRALQHDAACCSMLQRTTRDSYTTDYVIERNPPGGFPIYYVPSSRTVGKRTFLEEPGTSSSREVLFLTVLDEGT